MHHQVASSLQTQQSASSDGEEALRKRLAQLQTSTDLLKGERDGAAKKLADAEKELREVSGRAEAAEEKLQQQVRPIWPLSSPYLAPI